MYIYKLDRHLLERQIRKFSHFIGGRVLDLGAGNYNRYGKLFKYTEYIKMDIEKSENVDVVGSATDIPFADGSFDAIVSTQVFEHITDPEKAAEEVSRVLKNGGYFLITVPQTNELHSEPYDFWRYTSFGLVELFGRHGFEQIRTEQLGGFFSTISHMTMRYFIDRWNLHDHRFWGRVFSKVFALLGKLAIFLDSLDRSVANRKHTLGWCVVFKKLAD